MKNIGFLKTNDLKILNENNNCLVEQTFTHSAASGQTGCGKTSVYMYPNIEERIKAYHGILIYDYKGKEHLSVKNIAKKFNRLEDVIEVGKSWGKKINIIKHMNRADLFNFFVTLNGRNEKSSSDMFWPNSSANICTEVSLVLKQFHNIICLFDDSEKKYIKKLKDAIFTIDFNFDYSLSNLLSIVSSKQNLINFIKNMEELHLMPLYIIENSLSSGNLTYLHTKKRYIKIKTKIESLKKTILSAKKALSIFLSEEDEKSSSRTTLDSLITCINTPLSSVASIEYFNVDEIDVMEQLNKGKIVVVNTKSIPENLLESFNASIFNELTKRSQLDVNPISIFIDEAQRVVSPNFDLPLDVLRECKVELFLAYQNEELMIDKLQSEIKYYSFIKNLKSTFKFRNPIDNNNEVVTQLKEFEFIKNDDNSKIYKANKPYFIDMKDMFEAEYEYQEYIGLKDQFVITDDIPSKFIYMYDDSLISENKVIVKTIKKEFITDLYPKEVYEKTLETFNEYEKNGKLKTLQTVA